MKRLVYGKSDEFCRCIGSTVNARGHSYHGIPELSKQLKERQKAEQNQEGSDDPVLDALEMVTERAQEGDSTARPLHMRDIEAAAAAGRTSRRIG